MMSAKTVKPMGVHDGFAEVGIKVINNNIIIIDSITDGLGHIVSSKQTAVKTVREPIDINKKLKKGEIREVRRILEEIITCKLPMPEQVESLSRLPSIADSLKGQAILKFCNYHKCLCPLFFSQLGCVDLAENDIIPTSLTSKIRYFHKRAPLLRERRVYQKLFSVLRQYQSWTEVKKMMDKLREREKLDEDLAIISYGDEEKKKEKELPDL